MVASVGGVGNVGQLHAMSKASGKRPMAEALNSLWSAMDPQGSGSVSRNDFSAGMANANAPGLFANLSPNELFDKIDTDKDGQVSREQFREGLKNILDDLKAQRGGSFAEILAGAGGQSSTLSAGASSLASILNRKGSASDGLVDIYA